MEKLNGLALFLCFQNYLGSRKADDLSVLYSLTIATNLVSVDLGQNQFGGVLPESICNFSTGLMRFKVDINEIGGSIPACIGNLISLERFDLSSNHLGGKIPASIGNLQKLHYMSLSDNNFFGKIPSSF